MTKRDRSSLLSLPKSHVIIVSSVQTTESVVKWKCLSNAAVFMWFSPCLMLMRSIIERMFLVHSTRYRRENMRFSINMAASSAWRTVLNKHQIFDELRKYKDDQKLLIDSTNILAIQDGEIFVWDSYNSHLLTTNLKNLVQRDEKSPVFQVCYFDSSTSIKTYSVCFEL